MKPVWKRIADSHLPAVKRHLAKKAQKGSK